MQTSWQKRGLEFSLLVKLDKVFPYCACNTHTKAVSFSTQLTYIFICTFIKVTRPLPLRIFVLWLIGTRVPQNSACKPLSARVHTQHDFCNVFEQNLCDVYCLSIARFDLSMYVVFCSFNFLPYIFPNKYMYNVSAKSMFSLAKLLPLCLLFTVWQILNSSPKWGRLAKH